MPFGWKCALRTAKPIYAFFILSLCFATLKLQRKHPVISSCCRLQDAEKADIQKTRSIIRIDFPPPDTLVAHSSPVSGPRRPLFNHFISFQVVLVTFFCTCFHAMYTELILYELIMAFILSSSLLVMSNVWSFVNSLCCSVESGELEK